MVLESRVDERASSVDTPGQVVEVFEARHLGDQGQNRVFLREPPFELLEALKMGIRGGVYGAHS